MGQFSDDIIDGACCSLCMEYFEETHDYPVVCKGCWKDLSDEDKKMHTLAKFDVIN